MNTRSASRWTIGVVGWALLAAGCQSAMIGYQGARLQDGAGIVIEEGAHDGLYQTRDLSVRYHYERSGEQLRIAGEVTFQDAIKMNFNLVHSFHLSLVAADADRQVLGGYGLRSIGYWSPNDPLPFGRTMTVPGRATLMAFTYQGNAREGGKPPGFRGAREDDGIRTSFWELPLVR